MGFVAKNFRAADALDAYLQKRNRYHSWSIVFATFPEEQRQARLHLFLWPPRECGATAAARRKETVRAFICLKGILDYPCVPFSRGRTPVVAVEKLSASVSENGGNVLVIKTAGSIRVPRFPPQLSVDFKVADVWEQDEE